MNNSSVLIAVMGTTGVGKTSFINLVSGSDLRVGEGLRSCTSQIQQSQKFELDGRYVTLVDTPGFDDTMKSDSEILKLTSEFLAQSYSEGQKLSGIIYMHRISDPRMGGISIRNFGLFRKLCGTDSLKNVILVTNWWGNVEPVVGEEREKELVTDDKFWKPALDAGATTLRHNRTRQNAEDILRRLIGNVPRAFLIQEQLVDKGMRFVDTDAGSALKDALEKQALEHELAMHNMRVEMEAAIKDNVEATRKELEDELQRVEGEVNDLRQAMKDLEKDDQNYERAKDAGGKIFRWIGARKLGRKIGGKIYRDTFHPDS